MRRCVQYALIVTIAGTGEVIFADDHREGLGWMKDWLREVASEDADGEMTRSITCTPKKLAMVGIVPGFAALRRFGCCRMHTTNFQLLLQPRRAGWQQ